MSTPNSKPELSISTFADRTGLSIKALRLYDASGLLRPAAVDSATGYRRYDRTQIEVGRLVALLRAIDMSLADIATLLETFVAGEDATAHLDRYQRKLAAAHQARQIVFRHVRSILQSEEPTMFTIQTRSVPAQRGMSIIKRLRADQTDEFVAAAKAAFRQQLNGAAPTGPFTVIFHGRVDDENDGPIEAFLGCPEAVPATDAIGIRTEAAHDEAYTTITKAQWAFPAILAAYDAVAASAEATARAGSALSCREVYLAEPEAVDLADEICDVAFPLA